MPIPTTYGGYLEQLRKELNAIEQASAGASGLDERIDITNKMLIHVANLLAAGLTLQLPAPSAVGIPPYNVRKLDLTTAKTTDDPEEVLLTGDMLTFYTDGTLDGIQFALDSPVNDWIPISEFGNPYRYPAKFNKFYMSWTAQTDRYLRVHIGREAGAEAQIQITTSALATRPVVDFGQTTVGAAAVQLSATSFVLHFGIMLKADDDNANNIYVGDSTVTAATGFRLIAGQAMSYEISNTNLVFLIADAAGQVVHYIGV